MKRVGFLQFCPIRNNPQSNVAALTVLIKNQQFDLLVLPELANTGYFYTSKEEIYPFAEQNNGEGLLLSALIALCQKTGGIIVTGYAEKTGSKLFNAAAAVSKDGVLANYRKTHLFDHEKELFSPGDGGFNVYHHQGMAIGMMICFDWIYPEAARTLALQGAQIIAHPANLVLPYCQSAMITRSLENRVYTITANRIGSENIDSETTLSFTGCSQITAPEGHVIYRTNETDTQVYITDIDETKASNKWITPNNHLFNDRQPGFYQ